ncbi:ATP-dependent RecD-like DNA helicase [Megasphaera sp. UPII 135-E]|uniref:SF1B family DNA helicase RecD2 n=1 Tax=Megasphaera sp. UPII 135-E TaxID=1000569 RepID=UPI00021A1959|nr:ATP-dependent RecD-like DNA helicase [Megasphaera sp. UPII 135-E]EGS36731.1 helicase, RecD/TraA family [Megasphaera sp. UPII 135-E]
MSELNEWVGIVERILFISKEKDFYIFVMSQDGGPQKVTVKGSGPAVTVGERIRVHGKWVQHHKYGRQIAAQAWQILVSDTLEGTKRFLASSYIPGMGPVLAQRIVDTFGNKAMDILQNEPERLLQIEGMGKQKLESIRKALADKERDYQVALDLEQHGISGKYAIHLINAYESHVLEVLKTDAYRLIQDIQGIGFIVADKIALAYGMDTHHKKRICAALYYVLEGETYNGNVCVPQELLIQETVKLLHVEEAVVADTLTSLVEGQFLKTEEYQHQVYVYLIEKYCEEVAVARRIREMSKIRDKNMCGVELFLKTWQKESDFTLAKEQQQAVKASVRSPILVITGGPGTGKTTIIQAVIKLAEQRQERIALCAPTGRAAKRLHEATSHKAETVHRLLGANGKSFEYDEDNLLSVDLVIVDEVSMLDMNMCYHLFQALPEGCRCIFVGDADQLPSVGVGRVLHDLIRSEQIPVVRLKTIFRQKNGGRIVTNAHLINQGQFPICNEDSEFTWIEVDSEEEGAAQITALYGEIMKKEDDLFSVQVLSPMYKNPCGVDNLNALIQEKYNPSQPNKSEYCTEKWTFRVGDKVMQRQNNYDEGIFNGDMGTVFSVQAERVFVRFAERDVSYTRKDISQITPAYATTVHKSQGSEYGTVILAFVNSQYIMLQRNLFYTAVTRAKKRVILVGMEAAIQRAVANVRNNQRYTLLAERLRGKELW